MFKNLKFLVFILLCCSCQEKEDQAQLGHRIISDNLPVLLDGLDYFNIANTPLSAELYPYVGRIESDEQTLIDKFQDKFNLNNEKIFSGTIEIKKIPEKIGHYLLFLNKHDDFTKRNNRINISFVNLIISKNNRYACVEVVKSLGIGAKFEVFYFKQVNDKWIFDGKEVIALG
ncbi:hypothetical protein [Chryseobacterium sp. JUb7]|uniref:hypothetical protein n=1 Tax=Chryseobacterium sp. JUb7 TaxID=2940599 RepID=UPI00216773D1|nr:hypothetical protein [Chryseobacterium sp. JUb7]MCS3529347.1 hypothetical protein [Chryseobacterium sp. JUb7]